MIYPPRPKHVTKHERLDGFDYGDFIAQAKLNGSCTVLPLSKKEFEVWTRHKSLLTRCDRTLDWLSLHRGKGDMILCGEYMNKSKKGKDGKTFNNKFIIWDIVKYGGKDLIGTRFDERLALLHKIYSFSDFDGWISQISDDFFIANPFEEGFVDLYKKIVKIDMYEGLVLKKRHGILEKCDSDSRNKLWQFKVRKPTNSYNI